MADEEPTGPDGHDRLREALANKHAEDSNANVAREWGRLALRWGLLGVVLLLGAIGANQLPATGYWLWGPLHSMAGAIGAAGGYALIVGARYRGLDAGWRRRQLLANHEIHGAYTRGFDAGYGASRRTGDDDV